MRKPIGDYYADISSDNLSDHIPLFMKLNCTVKTAPNKPALVPQSKPVCLSMGISKATSC